MVWLIHRLLVSHCAASLLVGVLVHQCSSFPPTSSPRTHSYNLFGKPGDGYYIHLQIGTPPQKFNVLVDTGSSNLAIAATPHEGLSSYFVSHNSSTYKDMAKQVNVLYTKGSWKGVLGCDLVEFPGVAGAVPVYSDIALITTSNQFYINNSNWQGIVGLAYAVLSQPAGAVVPWLDRIVAQQHTSNSFTLQLCGPDAHPNSDSHSGRLFIGSAPNDCPPSVVTTPIRRAWFYEVLVIALGVGNDTLNLPCVKYNTDKSIVDSGTSNLRLPPDVFKAVIAALQSHTLELIPSLSENFWLGNEEVCWPQDHQAWDIFPNITVHLAYNNSWAFSMTVPPQSYLRPAMDSVNITTCWVLGLDQSHTGTVLGTVALEGLCVTFHRADSVIGFSESTCGPDIILGDIYKSKVDFQTCVYVGGAVDGVTLASYMMAGLLGLLCLPLVLATLSFVWRATLSPRLNPHVQFLTLDETNT